MTPDIHLAVLIDGDNVPSNYVKEMLEEIAKYGNPTIKRIYGDWTNPRLKKWKDVLLQNAIVPIQQYGYTSGKNATDQNRPIGKPPDMPSYPTSYHPTNVRIVCEASSFFL